MGHGDRHDDEPQEGPDEVPDDEHEAPLGAPPDPMDRVWLHPTELSGLAAERSAPDSPTTVAGSEPRRRRAAAWLVPLAAGATGAIVAVIVLALAGAFDRSAPRPESSSADNGTAVSAISADTLSRLGASVVAVVARDASGTRHGSAVCVRHDGELLTTASVVGSANTVDVFTADGQRHTGKVLGRDPVTDLALVSVNNTAIDAAQLASQSPVTGTHVWLLGATPTGSTSPWMSGGIISSSNATVVASPGPTTTGLLQSDAAAGTAASGGALLDQQGNVTAVVLGRVTNDPTTYAVPITTAVAVAEQLRDDGKAEHGTLGFEGIDSPSGPAVMKVAAKGPAARAGLRPGDVVEWVDGHYVESISDVTAWVRSAPPGRTVLLGIRRGKNDIEMHAVLGATSG